MTAKVRDYYAAETERIDRTPKPCTHPNATHEHGTHMAYVSDGCRCLDCLDAHNAYGQHRRRQIAYGRWSGLVDATPAREHVNALRRRGMGIADIVNASGVSVGSVNRLIYGRPSEGLAPSAALRSATAEKLLSVTYSVDHLRGGVLIDGTGARRRLQALMAIGYSRTAIARHLGCSKQNVWFLMNTEHATVAKHRMICDLYDALWDAPPVERDARDRRVIRDSKALARRNGWAPPLAWDDDAIDNPDATPDLGSDSTLTTSERHAENVADLLTHHPHATLAQLADRLGISANGLHVALVRAGADDLREQLNRNAELEGHTVRRRAS